MLDFEDHWLSPLRCVVPEIVKGSLNQQPVKIIIGVLVASDVSQVGGVIGWVLMDIHRPYTTT